MNVIPQPVRFTRMQDGTAAEWATVKAAEQAQKNDLPRRVLGALSAVESEGVAGYQVNRVEHVLQSATRAYRDGQSTDYVVAALIHDIGDILAPYSHGELAAAVITPFVEPRITWILRHHPIFSMYYYAHHTGGDRHARERFRGHEWFEDAVFFCENYDENCFDPDYDWLPMEHFAPMVHDVFTRTLRHA